MIYIFFTTINLCVVTSSETTKTKVLLQGGADKFVLF